VWLKVISNSKFTAVLVLVLIGLCIAAVSSYYRWQDDCLSYEGHICADHYCEYSELITETLRYKDLKHFKDLERFYQNNRIATSPVTPIIAGIIYLISDGRIENVFAFTSFLFSVASLILMAQIIRERWKLDRITILSLLPFVYFHLLFNRSLVRAITDGAGLFFTTVLIYCAWKLSSNPPVRTKLYLGAALLIGMFSRISMLSAPLFLTLWFAYLVVNQKKNKFIDLAVLYGPLLLILFILITAASGSLGTIFAAYDVGRHPHFAGFHNPRWFSACLLIAFQFFPILWIIFRNQIRFGIFEKLNLFWIIFYTVFMIATGGAFWSRYFIPLLPSIFFISVPILKYMLINKSKLYAVILAIFIAINLGIIYVNIMSDLNPLWLDMLLR